MRNTLFAITAFALLASTAQLSAQKIIKFDAPGAGTGANQGTWVRGINAFGLIDGGYKDTQNVFHGFLRTNDGKFIPFDPPGLGTHNGQGPWPEGLPAGINIMGAVVSNYTDVNYGTHGYVRAADGKITTFDAPGAGAGVSASGNWLGTYPQTINDFGEIAGYYIDANDVWHGFFRDFRGKITTFDAPGAGTLAGQGTFVNYTAPSLNDLGTLADYYQDANNVFHGYLRTREGKFIEIDAPPGMGTDPWEGVILSSINLEGVVTGICIAPGQWWHACARSRNGKWEVFDLFPSPDGAVTIGEQINNFGAITGYAYDQIGFAVHGFLRSPDGKMTAIDVPGAGTEWPGGTEADVINDLGMVAGTYTDANSVTHGWLRLPK